VPPHSAARIRQPAVDADLQRLPYDLFPFVNMGARADGGLIIAVRSQRES
jgi:hypothetical protein